MFRYLLVATGGMIGAVARYWLSGVASTLSSRFPYGTLLVNLVGCFIIGAFLTLAYERFNWSPDLRIFFVVGFLGAFTTFSAFSYETVSLLREGTYAYAVLNMAASLFGCLAATILGIVIVKKI